MIETIEYCNSKDFTITIDSKMDVHAKRFGIIDIGHPSFNWGSAEWILMVVALLFR